MRTTPIEQAVESRDGAAGAEVAALVARLPRAEDGVDHDREHVCERCGHAERVTIRVRGVVTGYAASMHSERIVKSVRCPRCRRRNWAAYRPLIGSFVIAGFGALMLWGAPWYAGLPVALSGVLSLYTSCRPLLRADDSVFLLPETRSVPRLGPYGR
jgi:hypothetical protein